jgi:hypothetical protein
LKGEMVRFRVLLRYACVYAAAVFAEFVHQLF